MFWIQEQYNITYSISKSRIYYNMRTLVFNTYINIKQKCLCKWCIKQNANPNIRLQDTHYNNLTSFYIFNFLWLMLRSFPILVISNLITQDNVQKVFSWKKRCLRGTNEIWWWVTLGEDSQLSRQLLYSNLAEVKIIINAIRELHFTQKTIEK